MCGRVKAVAGCEDDAPCCRGFAEFAAVFSADKPGERGHSSARGNPAYGLAVLRHERVKETEIFCGHLLGFAEDLFRGVTADIASIDERITAAAAHWSMHRMAATDRNLLRIGAYELLFTETPARVVIDEAVELAKRFGGAQSAQFVNGILDHLMHQSKPAGATGAVGGLSPEA